jgi:hypothetical protein
MIDIIIKRLADHGYRYEKGYFNLDKIPDTVRPKSLYINMLSLGDGAEVSSFSLRNASVMKPVQTSITVNLIDSVNTVVHSEYVKKMREIVLSVLTLNKNEYPKIVKININGSRFIENETYLIFSVNINYTEV